MKYTLISIHFLLVFAGCIGKNSVAIKSKIAKTQTATSTISISNIKILNNQFILTGTNLNSATSVVIKEGITSTSLAIESQTSTGLVANTVANITLAAGSVFEFVVTSANASATFTVDFSLCSSSIGGKLIDCTTTPNDKEVLSYDASSGKWKPRAVNGLSYQGVWDASGSLPTATTEGEYFIVSVASGNYAVGDWIVYNGTTFEKVSNSNTVTSVFGRTGAVTANEADYILGKMGDVDFTSATPTTNQYLKFNGTNWVPASVASTTETDPNVMTFAKTTLPTCGAGEVLKGNGTSLSCVTDNTGSGAFSGTANRVIVSDGSGSLSVSAVNSTELGYVSGVTSAIQTQITNIAATASALTNSSLSSNMTSGNIFVGSAGNVATGVSLSGDATISNTGALTIASNSVALGTDTTGNYVLNLTASNGLQATAAAGEGTTPNLVLGGSLTGNSSILLNSQSFSFVGATYSLGLDSFGTTTMGNVDINGGTIDATTIGATTRSSAEVTSLAATAAYVATASVTNLAVATANITGGTIENVTVGLITRAVAAFTTVSATAAYIATASITNLAVATANISAGSINGTTIGATTATTATFTTVTATAVALPAPVSGSHAANKDYVDASVDDVESYIEPMQSMTGNRGIYNNKIITMSPPNPYRKICLKNSSIGVDEVATGGTSTSVAGTCAPGDIGFVMESTPRAGNSWTRARFECLKNNMRLPEPFERQLACLDGGISQTGSWEWSSNETIPIYSSGVLSAQASAIFGVGGTCYYYDWGYIGGNSGQNHTTITYLCAR
ncbi:MAG: hypothetical protein U0T83_05740 [Bacteriovoracaceae bacterium]